MTWKTKEQTVATRSSAKANHGAKAVKAHTCELLRLKGLIGEFFFKVNLLIAMCCNICHSEREKKNSCNIELPRSPKPLKN